MTIPLLAVAIQVKTTPTIFSRARLTLPKSRCTLIRQRATLAPFRRTSSCRQTRLPLSTLEAKLMEMGGSTTKRELPELQPDRLWVSEILARLKPDTVWRPDKPKERTIWAWSMGSPRMEINSRRASQSIKMLEPQLLKEMILKIEIIKGVDWRDLNMIPTLSSLMVWARM